LSQKNTNLRSLSESIDIKSASGKLIYNFFGVLAMVNALLDKFLCLSKSITGLSTTRLFTACGQTA